ncbi:hypothetical protein [Myroides odoratus]|jgi:predicted hotdog family 3-hydroxylacyl-ACP dehydratase|uniref:(3R)-hydroxymyristoyl-ACP dehydratase n=1 Tax=Myroides odoratus TaxID=256 RepID=A0A9Q7E7W0_MYROD|nr:hypothetical protein [Myroides odoratus]EHQ42555.1 flexirubin-type pigment biosynthesis acyl carrier protein DarC1 [Myroides odoratus DSM 2801]EKB07936.1 hypothetical protein HMPREF9716_01578 [Myroides odoratus CIP 103059]MDR0224595.1 hypothetical protein [Myroides odoratus]QQT99925.1 hypothetical protein I6I88_17460 [Myroides odoratus]WQD57859.1 hypothetical protein U0010_01490 [Myroides odoratus]
MQKKELIAKELVGTLIPQRAPIVMVDALYQFGDDFIEAGLSIQKDNLCVANEYMQEPGIIEHMAQAVALHTGYAYYLKDKAAPTGYIGSIKKIEITQLPKVGDQLITRAQILHEFMGVTLVELTTTCNDIIIATGQMKTVLAQS